LNPTPVSEMQRSIPSSWPDRDFSFPGSAVFYDILQSLLDDPKNTVSPRLTFAIIL
jgi:hypothetical protein